MHDDQYQFDRSSTQCPMIQAAHIVNPDFQDVDKHSVGIPEQFNLRSRNIGPIDGHLGNPMIFSRTYKEDFHIKTEIHNALKRKDRLCGFRCKKLETTLGIAYALYRQDSHDQVKYGA